ncbi:MAG: glycosyltransferase family 39 protein, partial [Chroococcidiopsis sp.]
MLLQRTSRERIRASNFKYYLVIGLTLAIGIFLRFFLLQDKSLWLDEGASLYYSDGTSIQAIISTIVTTDTGDRFQPLYYLVLYFWRQLFGSSEFAVRSLSALLGIGTIVVLCTTAWQLYGRKHALWLTLFLSFSAYGVYYSQQTRAYTLLLFLASLQLYFLSQILPQKNVRGTAIAQVLFCITTAVGLFCSIFIGIYTLALCIAHLLVSKNIKRWLQWWLPVAIACLPAAIFYLASPVATDPTKVHVTPSNQSVIQNIAFVFYGLLVGETYGPPIEQMRGGDRLQ